MKSRDYQGIVGGGVLMALGLFVIAYSLSTLRLGTLQRLGSGGFPTALGVILIVFGIIILIPALRTPGTTTQIALFPFLTITASLLVFAAVLRSLGLVPSVILMTVIAGLPDKNLTLVKSLILGIFLASAAALIFPIGLGIRMPIFAWNW
ncbi:tripartite tricarboxylate transporter TctB family protein [Pseudochelatococcus sp. B33]